MKKEESFAEQEKNSEIRKEIQELLDEKTGALCFIAPYVPEKITPTKIARAFIDIPEEFMIEDALTELKKSKIEKLMLLLNSLGGSVSSSYKIAKALRKNFKDKRGSY